MADLFHETTQTAGRTNGRIVAEYPYHDESGFHLYDVVQFYTPPGDKKKYAVRAANGSWGKKGIRMVPYRLPQLIKAVNAGRAVFIVEGEKDVNTLTQCGRVATTNPFGAGNWRAEYSDCLRDATVYVLPDNDGAGRDHAADVVRQLTGIAKEIRVVELPDLPEKGDVTDWMSSGGTVEALRDIVRSTPRFSTQSTANKVEKEQDPGFYPALSETEDIEAVLGEAWEVRAKPTLSDAAFAGPIGEVVSICAPQCEGSPISILLPALAMYGCMVGRRAVQDIGGTHHFLNVFGLLVGDSGEGRKGTGNGVAHRVMGMIDLQFIHDNVKGGLSSGEGLIGHIADQKNGDGEIVPRDTRLHISEGGRRGIHADET